MKNETIRSALELAGFVRSPTASNIYVIDDKSVISPAYFFGVVKKSGKVRLAGAIGLYFTDFEKTSGKSSYRIKVSDDSLPFVMAVDNYVDQIDSGFFEFVDDFEEILRNSLSLFNLCSRMPNSPDSFDYAISSCSILGKKLQDYLNLFDYYSDDNPRFRKSMDFISWLYEIWPDRAHNLYECLSYSQQRRIQQQLP